MNKKGFTLTELLGVIVVLAVIVSIAGMSAVSIMNKSKAKLYDEMEDNLKDAAITYALENRKEVNFEDGNDDKVTVGTLINEGYFEDNDNYCNRESAITIKRTSEDYEAYVPEGTCGNK